LELVSVVHEKTSAEVASCNVAQAQ